MVVVTLEASVVAGASVALTEEVMEAVTEEATAKVKEKGQEKDPGGPSLLSTSCLNPFL